MAQSQMARQNATLFTMSARLYAKFRESCKAPPIRYPVKYLKR